MFQDLNFWMWSSMSAQSVSHKDCLKFGLNVCSYLTQETVSGLLLVAEGYHSISSNKCKDLYFRITKENKLTEN